MSKKIIIFLSVILVIMLGVFALYYFLTKDSVDNTGRAVGFRSFFPFGGEQGQPEQEATTTPETPAQTIDNQNFTKKLRKLSVEPVAGAGAVDVKAGTYVRYIEKATGHIYEVELFSPRQARISNTTMPMVYDALWNNKGSSIIARYLEDNNNTVDTYYLNIKNTSTTTENVISGISMTTGISDVSVFNDSVFYITTDGFSSKGFSSNFDGTKKKQVWSSEINELNSQYVNSKTVSLTTKPYEGVPGFMYFVDTTTGGIKRILGNIKGLSTLVDRLAENILYLEQTDTAMMYSYNIKTKTKTLLNPATFPEKCVWSTKEKDTVYCAVPKGYISNQSLTMWYRGTISFSDDIWKYNTKTNVSSIIADLEKESGESMDVYKPILSQNEQYIVFINRKDDSLWSLDLLQN